MGKESWYSPLNTLGPQVSHKKLLPADILMACLEDQLKVGSCIRLLFLSNILVRSYFFEMTRRVLLSLSLDKISLNNSYLPKIHYVNAASLGLKIKLYLEKPYCLRGGDTPHLATRLLPIIMASAIAQT